MVGSKEQEVIGLPGTFFSVLRTQKKNENEMCILPFFVFRFSFLSGMISIAPVLKVEVSSSFEFYVQDAMVHGGIYFKKKKCSS